VHGAPGDSNSLLAESMRLLSCLLALVLVAALAGCGGSNTTPTNVGLFGNWNVVTYPRGSQNPSYVFALALSQEGNNNYSGGSITYNGGIAPPSGMCIDANTLHATATTSGSNFTMTVTDSTTSTVISITGTLTSENSTLSGNYSNDASAACIASQGTMSMTAQ
jgi:hypothetical protein